MCDVMEVFWVVLSTALLSFCLCKISYRAGYKAGARGVLEEWKKTINDMGEE